MEEGGGDMSGNDGKQKPPHRLTSRGLSDGLVQMEINEDVWSAPLVFHRPEMTGPD